MKVPKKNALIPFLIVAVSGPVSVVSLGTPASATTQQDAVAAAQGYLDAVDGQLLSTPETQTAISAFALDAGESSAADTNASQAAVAYELGKSTQFRDWAASHSDTYTSVDSALVVGAVTVSGSRATVTGEVTTTMLWSTSATGETLPPEKEADVASARAAGRAFAPGETVTSEVATNHLITMAQTSRGWKIVSDAYVDPFNEELAADHVTPRSEPGASDDIDVSGPADAGTAGTPTPDLLAKAAAAAPASHPFSYNRGRAAAYADRYWRSYNRVYPNCNPVGGDCANFVSQALWDPGAANFPSERPYWHPGGLTTCGATATAWRYTPAQHRFFVANPRGSAYNFASLGKKGSASYTRSYNIRSMFIGDVIFDDWTSNGEIDHVTIAVAYAGDNSTLIDAHNTNRRHTRWDFGGSRTTYYHDKFKNTITVP
ncbi:amidase domain-containing protein [Nonomuraea sp. NPDC050556]|uniref:amidase domain-containing protein n=1 Tax=Nonomuraea sp. NPDC050556 TaxID=3364369 RepID=UPI003787F6DD